ncbi:MAG: zinc ribbon domain-containing protein [bacterium]|nr:zinc ribbon domain-containing protein [bacterium]
MPTYEYRCRSCDARFEVRQSFAEDSLTSCPSAGSEQSPAACLAPGEGEVRKVFSAPSISFKGDGFYKTDSRSSAGRATNGSKDQKPAEQATKSDEGATKSGEGAAKSSGSGSKDSSGATTGDSKGDRATAGASSS